MIKNWVDKFVRLVDVDLTRFEFLAETKLARFIWRQLRLSVYVGRRLAQGRHTERAAALTFLSLLSIVPLLAVIVSLFKALGGMDAAMPRLQDYIIENVPTGADVVREWLGTFARTFDASAVGLFGFVGLLVTVIPTLSAIENALNSTWGVRRARGWGMRLVVYWCLLTVGPILLGMSLAATASLQSSHVVQWLAHSDVPFIPLLKSVVPIATSSLLFAAVYYILPGVRVRVGAALTGGVSAAILFETAKWLYAWYTSRSVSTHSLYGSLAAFPLFIVWINYSWRIVLFGADIVHATQYAATDPTEETDPRTNQATREEAAVRIAAVVARHFREGMPPPSTYEISRTLMLPAHMTQVLCGHLLSHGLVRETNDQVQPGGLVPSRALEELTVADIITVMRRKVGIDHWPTSDDRQDIVDNLLLNAERQQLTAMSQVTWQQLAVAEEVIVPKIQRAAEALRLHSSGKTETQH